MGGSSVVHRRPVTRRLAAVAVLSALLSSLLPSSTAVAAGPEIGAFDVVLPAGSSISGTVEDEGGDPVAGIAVNACTLAEDCGDGDTTASDGTFTVRGLKPEM